MTAKKARGVTILTAASEEDALARDAAAREKQNEYARTYAAGIERGELPATQDEREFIALILRWWADRPPPQPQAKRGNPRFKRKVYSPDSVALEVLMRIKSGDDSQAAIAYVAELLDVDESTIGKVFRDRREDVARFLGINIGARDGAIRGE